MGRETIREPVYEVMPIRRASEQFRNYESVDGDVAQGLSKMLSSLMKE